MQLLRAINVNNIELKVTPLVRHLKILCFQPWLKEWVLKGLNRSHVLVCGFPAGQRKV